MTYTNEQRKIRDLIINEKELFDDIIFSRKLGANRHISMIGDMVIDVLNNEKNDEKVLENVNDILEFFITTRGTQSRAVYNGLLAMTPDLSKIEDKKIDEVRKLLVDHISTVQSELTLDVEKAIIKCNNLAVSWKKIMIFDYSSSLNSFILQSNKDMTVVIPESRALDGGKPFLEALKSNGNKIEFIPDMTIQEKLKECDAAMIGAESFYADGTVFNTIGSDMVAVSCKYLGVPFYVLTTMIKLDYRSLNGVKKLSPMPYDYGKTLTSMWKEDDKIGIHFEGIKLTSIEPELITAFITENAITPYYGMYHESMKYINEKLGGLDEK